MNITVNGALGRPLTGTPAPASMGAAVWRVRQVHGAQSVPSLFVTDVPVTKPSVSASERCP